MITKLRTAKAAKYFYDCDVEIVTEVCETDNYLKWVERALEEAARANWHISHSDLVSHVKLVFLANAGDSSSLACLMAMGLYESFCNHCQKMAISISDEILDAAYKEAKLTF